MKRLFAFLFFLSSLILNSTPAQAAEFRTGFKENENVTVAASEKLSNLYAAGNLLTIDADIAKSLYLGGKTININGDVEDDLKAGGETILVKGNVGGSVHLGGGTVVIDSEIADDLFVGAGTLTISSAAKIGGGFYAGAGTVDLQAPVVGDAFIGGKKVIINSTITGDVKVEADELVLGDKAVLKGDLTYSSPREVEMADNATISGVVDYKKLDQERFGSQGKFENKEVASIFGAFAVGTWMMKLVGALVSSFTIFLLLIKLLKNSSKELSTNFWSNAVMGFTLMIMLPIASIILFFTIFGIWLSGLNLIVYGLLMMLAKATASIIFGLWLMKLFTKKNAELSWQPVLLGALVLSTISMIPVLGGLVCFVFLTASFGSYYQMLYKYLLKK